MEQVMDTMRNAGSRVLAALCETGKAVAGFVTGVVKSVSYAVAGFVKDGTCKAAGCTWSKVKQFVKDNRQLFPGQKEIKQHKAGALPAPAFPFG